MAVMPVDALRLEGLSVDCILGDLPEERTVPRTVLVDVELSIDLSAASRSDLLHDTVDYATLAERIRAALRAAECRLVERAAGIVADVCMRADARIACATATVRKSGGIPGLGAVACTISRDRAPVAAAPRVTRP